MTGSPFVLPQPALHTLTGLGGVDTPATRRGRALAPGGEVQPPQRDVDARDASRRARLLIVGDDSGLGGATTAPSLRALLARRFPCVAIVDTCRKGMRVADAAQALARGAPGRQRFDLALVLLGANDVVQQTPQRELGAAASALLHELQWHATHIVWLGSSSTGDSPSLPAPLDGWASRRCRRTMRTLAQAARAQGATFVDLCPPRAAASWHVAARNLFAGDERRRDRADALTCLTVLEQRVPLQAWLSGPGRSASLPNRPIQE